MRRILSVAIAFFLFLAVGYLIFSGNIVILDFWTGLAVALIPMAIAVLIWGFKSEITHPVKGEKNATLKAILKEIKVNHEIITNAEETERGTRISPNDFPFSTEIYESLRSKAALVDADLLSMLQKCYQQTRKLNAANSKTESPDKLTADSSPYGWMKFRDSDDYYYIKDKISEIDDLLVETMGLLRDKIGHR